MLSILAYLGDMLQFGQNSKTDFDGKEHSSFSLAEVRLDYKFEKVHTGVDPKDRIFGGCLWI